MESGNTSEDTGTYAYQSPVAMPAVGIRATDWIIYRPARSASGNPVLVKFRGAVDVGHLTPGPPGEHLFYDGRTGKCERITDTDELEILGVVIAVRSEWAIH